MAEPSDGLARVLKLLGELVDELRRSEELEEITDVIVDELLERIPLPRFLPFVRGWLRKRLDALLPDAIFAAITAAVYKVKMRRAADDRLLR